MKFRFVVHSGKEGDEVVKKCFIWEEVKKLKLKRKNSKTKGKKRNKEYYETITLLEKWT